MRVAMLALCITPLFASLAARQALLRTPTLRPQRARPAVLAANSCPLEALRDMCPLTGTGSGKEPPSASQSPPSSPSPPSFTTLLDDAEALIIERAGLPSSAP